MISTRYTAPWRWAWALPVAAAAIITACDGDFSTGLQDSDWGFLFLDASKTASGQFVTRPEAVFFLGRLTSVPNAGLTTDTACTDGTFSGAGNNLSNVTYLDAGVPVTLKLGARTDELPRQASSSEIVYEPAVGTTIPYSPGDSLELTVPGAVGGFPAATIRARTAEAFTMDPITVPTSTETIQVRWTPSSVPNSALILELRYHPSGGANPTREVLCSFADDGIDSIPATRHAPWSAAAASARQIVATRLRTTYVNTTSGGILGVVSTFAVPTPTVP